MNQISFYILDHWIKAWHPNTGCPFPWNINWCIYCMFSSDNSLQQIIKIKLVSKFAVFIRFTRCWWDNSHFQECATQKNNKTENPKCINGTKYFLTHMSCHAYKLCNPPRAFSLVESSRYIQFLKSILWLTINSYH